MSCLDEDTILAFCRGALAPSPRARAEEHIASCDECRALVSAVARSTLAAGGDPATAATTPVGVRADGTAPATPYGDSREGPSWGARGRASSGSGSGSGSRSGGGAAGSPVAPGDVLAGKYEVEEVLGSGGMGVVVAARHAQLDQRVALKFLLPLACEVPGAVPRFLREGKAAARITSEHVARVMDVGTLDGGAPYLVMEYLEGEDLGETARARGRLPVTEAIDYVLQACEAVVEAHDLGIVHRDLKPANLFLTKRADGTPLVKVLDFGISKLEGGSRSQLTSASMLMGSPRYMSPEQMLSAKDVDARADVWGLGVILFELVSGRPVWEADTVQGLCALIASSPAPRLRSIVPEAPEVLDDVVARCLEKERGERIGSVAELALALEPIAPSSAKTSVERIVRVASRSRPIASRPPARSGPRPAVAQRVPLYLGLGILALIALGIAWNATLGHRRVVDASTGPTPVAEPSAAERVVAAALGATGSVDPAIEDASTAAAHATPEATIGVGAARPLPPRTPPAAARPAGTRAAPSASASASAPAAPPPLEREPPNTSDAGRALTERK